MHTHQCEILKYASYAQFIDPLFVLMSKVTLVPNENDLLQIPETYWADLKGLPIGLSYSFRHITGLVSPVDLHCPHPKYEYYPAPTRKAAM